MTGDRELRAATEAALGRDLARAAAPEKSEALGAVLRYGRPTETRSGRAFFYQGDKAEAAYLLLDGSVRPLQYKAGGKPIELPPLAGGDWLGLSELSLGIASSFDAIAEEACLSLAFPRYAFALASAKGAFAALVSRALAREVAALRSYIEDEGPAERILAFLLSRRRELAGTENAKVRVTQERIARAIGVTRETVNKRLAELEARGLLRTLRGEIEVLDWEALAAAREEA